MVQSEKYQHLWEQQFLPHFNNLSGARHTNYDLTRYINEDGIDEIRTH